MALLFEKIGKLIKHYDFNNEKYIKFSKSIILDLIEKDKRNMGDETFNIDMKIKNLKIKQSKLLDLQLDDKITQEVYLSKHNEFENEIKDLQEQKENIKNDDFEKKTQIMLELAGSFYQSYFRADLEGKNYITRKLMLELFIDNKKELRIEESPILQSSKLLNIHYGGAKKFNIRKYKECLSMMNLEFDSNSNST